MPKCAARPSLLLATALLLACGPVWAATIVRTEIEPGVFAAISGGRNLLLECRPPRGDAAKNFLGKYLADPAGWKQYKDRLTVAIPYARLNGKAQRTVLERLFPEDYVDHRGWWHKVTLQEHEGTESLWALSEWLTGLGTNYKQIQALEENRGISDPLMPGQTVFFPRNLLSEAMRTPTPGRAQAPRRAEAEGETPAYLRAGEDLSYSQDDQGYYAAYRLKKGEALYTSVVIRFTDFREKPDVDAACDVVMQRSGITNPRKLEPGQIIKIPIDMLSDRYQPEGSERRQAYEEMRQEARLIEAELPRTPGLEGVIIILDPGHGGRDYGAAVPAVGIYEDEITYDIVCRIKRILETTTRATVFVTVYDPEQQYEPTNAKRFVHDTTEQVTVTPYYTVDDAKISAHLRWMLANNFYREALKRGADENKMLFTSIHCDALHQSLSGAMVYIPGAAYRSDREGPNNPIFAQFKEYREQPVITTTAAMRRRDEAISRNFAETFIRTLRQQQIPVHTNSDPIRNVIRQSRNVAYVPAVLRGTMVPTKVLIETANIMNPDDRARLADPAWRQKFAEAYVLAVKAHFGG